MSQELGRLERPTTERFQGKRKLLVVPLIYGPPGLPGDGVAILQRYWEQVQTQISSLESRLGDVRHVYHESLMSGGDEGLQQLEALDQRSHVLVSAKCRTGATLEATEDAETFFEALDLQRCMMLPLTSQKVAQTLQAWLMESNRTRYEKIGSRIDETLGDNEVGLLFIGERHQVQFAQDVEVLYISPPAQADFQTWLHQWMLQQQAAMSAEPPDEG